MAKAKKAIVAPAPQPASKAPPGTITEFVNRLSKLEKDFIKDNMFKDVNVIADKLNINVNEPEFTTLKEYVHVVRDAYQYDPADEFYIKRKGVVIGTSEAAHQGDVFVKRGKKKNQNAESVHIIKPKKNG